MNAWQRLKALFYRQPGESRVFIPTRQAGVVVNEDTALTMPEWWACVSVISRAVASLPWGVYERTPAGRKPVYGTIDWLLNNQPNPEMTAFAFREAITGHALNWGNGYAEISHDLAGRPTGLWLMTPDRTCPERHPGDGRIRYRYTADDGSTVYLEASEVLHVHGLGFDGLTGYPLARMAARSIGIGIAQDTFGQAFYANGTTFGGMVEVGANLNKDQIANIEANLNAKHGGPAAAFKTRVVPQNTKYHSMSMPLTDAQFIESRQLSVTTVARWLGVPLHKIADLTRSTNNNIEHQGIEFVTDAIVPWALRFEQEANIKLFGVRTQGRVYTKMNVNSLMRGDSAARAAFYRTMSQIGAMSVNEMRALEEMNGIGPAGDAHLVQLNQTTLEYLVEHPDAKATGTAAPPPEGQPTPEPVNTPPMLTNVIRLQALEWLRERHA